MAHAKWLMLGRAQAVAELGQWWASSQKALGPAQEVASFVTGQSTTQPHIQGQHTQKADWEGRLLK